MALAAGLLPGDRLIVDRRLQTLYQGLRGLASVEQTCPVTADESLKSIDGLTPILGWLLDSGFNRSGVLYVVGGGTVQDAGCFIASILHRGARWIYVPTTLISQGDSCIGSKSSINYGGYKNQLGTFYPPAAVIIDEAFLETLPSAEIRSGLGELLHYAALGDEATFASYEAALARGWEVLTPRDTTALASRALAVKRGFVEADEFDTGIRKALNFGHTFGHALEVTSGGNMSHGVAVAYGIDLANTYAVSRGILAHETQRRIADVVRKLVDGLELATVDASRLLEAISRDKKRSNGDIEIVLIEAIGKAIRLTVPLDEGLRSFLDDCLADWHRQIGSGAQLCEVTTSMPSDRYQGSRATFLRATQSLARGVSSAMKATQEPVPICAGRGAGSRLWDVDGNEYVDFALSFGPMLLGQSPAVVLEAVRRQLDVGVGFGAGNRYEAPLAELLCEVVPSAELVIFSNTGTEAVQAALRVARAATGRNRIIKFSGHYHGWIDGVHVAIPGAAGNGAGTAGQDPCAAQSTTICEWNNIPALTEMLTDDVAAVIMEPINVNGGCFAPDPGYLKEVRRLTVDAGALLIFDEVITGFRVALGGAQELLRVVPDLTVLGKALGSGFPISAVCGSRDVMSVVASGRVAHMGNFNGNPIATAASHAAITDLRERRGDVYPRLKSSVEAIACAFEYGRVTCGLPLQFNRTIGAGFAFVSDKPLTNYQQRATSDSRAYGKFASKMLDEGIFIPARGLWYVSTEHSEEDISLASEAILRVATRMADEASRGIT